MARKTSKVATDSRKKESGRQGKVSHGEITDPYSDAGSGIVFMEGEDAPSFSPNSPYQQQEGDHTETSKDK